MEELPENWYDWSDFSPQNVKVLNNYIQVIKENIAEDVEYVDWSDNWGEAPSNLELNKRRNTKSFNEFPNIIAYFWSSVYCIM